jgi:hypothetical protein
MLLGWKYSTSSNLIFDFGRLGFFFNPSASLKAIAMACFGLTANYSLKFRSFTIINIFGIFKPEYFV